MKKYILALDEGTTSARAILFDRQAGIVSMAQHEIRQIYPAPGLVEQDPMEIYANQYAAMTECIAKSGVDPEEIAAVGITNQRETVIAWNRKTCKPLCNAIVWQCRRTAEACRALIQAGYAGTVKSTTGLRIDPYFSGTKIRWMLDHVPAVQQAARAGELAVGTVDSWLVFKLTEGRAFVTDRTNASRTMLCNIHTGEWDEGMLAMLDIPRCILPDIQSSSQVYGYLDCMGARIPIAGMAGDQQAALFGQGCFTAGQAKNTYGTGCFLLSHVGARPVLGRYGLLTTVAAGEQGRALEYALEGSVFVGGAVVRWLRDEMGLIRQAQESELLASTVPDSGGVYFVPAFSGLGAPYWDAEARGTLVGMTGGTGKAHIVRAALESIAYQTEDVIAAMNEEMQACGQPPISTLRVDGGASQNDLLMQMQSDVSGIAVQRCANSEATAAGAAFLAGLAVGFFESREALSALVSAGRSFAPAISPVEREKRMAGWHRAVGACRAFVLAK